MSQEINCAEACVNGCILGDKCPNLEYKAQAAEFIENTSLDKILEMAEESVRKRMLERASQPTQWILPED